MNNTTSYYKYQALKNTFIAKYNPEYGEKFIYKPAERFGYLDHIVTLKSDRSSTFVKYMGFGDKPNTIRLIIATFDEQSGQIVFDGLTHMVELPIDSVSVLERDTNDILDDYSRLHDTYYEVKDKNMKLFHAIKNLANISVTLLNIFLIISTVWSFCKARIDDSYLFFLMFIIYGISGFVSFIFKEDIVWSIMSHNKNYNELSKYCKDCGQKYNDYFENTFNVKNC